MIFCTETTDPHLLWLRVQTLIATLVFHSSRTADISRVATT